MTEAPRRGPAVEPREIMQESDEWLRVTWADGRACRLPQARAKLRRTVEPIQCRSESHRVARRAEQAVESVFDQLFQLPNPTGGDR